MVDKDKISDDDIVKSVKSKMKGGSTGALKQDKRVVGEPPSKEKALKSIMPDDEDEEKEVSEEDKDEDEKPAYDTEDTFTFKEHELKEKSIKDEELFENANGYEFSEMEIGIFDEATVMKNQNVIYKVAVLGKFSKNNHIYSNRALEQVVQLINEKGCKSFVDHSVDTVASVTNLIGIFKNGRISNAKVFADLELLENWREFIFDIAEKMPGSVGFSLVSKGSIEVDRAPTGEEVVSEILAIKCCDLVDNPASTSGIFGD